MLRLYICNHTGHAFATVLSMPGSYVLYHDVDIDLTPTDGITHKLTNWIANFLPCRSISLELAAASTDR